MLEEDADFNVAAVGAEGLAGGRRIRRDVEVVDSLVISWLSVLTSETCGWGSDLSGLSLCTSPDPEPPHLSKSGFVYTSSREPGFLEDETASLGVSIETIAGSGWTCSAGEPFFMSDGAEGI